MLPVSKEKVLSVISTVKSTFYELGMDKGSERKGLDPPSTIMMCPIVCRLH